MRTLTFVNIAELRLRTEELQTDTRRRNRGTLDRSGRPGGDLRVSDSEEKEPVIGFGNWMITMLLPFIPMIGPLVYMVMLFVWAFGGTNRTKKNWARAMLIMLIISIIMLMIMFGSVFSELGMQGILGDAVL